MYCKRKNCDHSPKGGAAALRMGFEARSERERLPALGRGRHPTGRKHGRAIGGRGAHRGPLRVCRAGASQGENPLYLPQAKVFDGSCAIGPGIELCSAELLTDVAIQTRIFGAGATVFQGETRSSQMKRRLPDLALFWGRELAAAYHRSAEAGCARRAPALVLPADHRHQARHPLCVRRIGSPSVRAGSQ